MKLKIIRQDKYQFVHLKRNSGRKRQEVTQKEACMRWDECDGVMHGRERLEGEMRDNSSE